jgi:hypothetical protein
MPSAVTIRAPNPSDAMPDFIAVSDDWARRAYGDAAHRRAYGWPHSRSVGLGVRCLGAWKRVGVPPLRGRDYWPQGQSPLRYSSAPANARLHGPRPLRCHTEEPPSRAETRNPGLETKLRSRRRCGERRPWQTIRFVDDLDTLAAGRLPPFRVDTSRHQFADAFHDSRSGTAPDRVPRTPGSRPLREHGRSSAARLLWPPSTMAVRRRSERDPARSWGVSSTRSDWKRR